LISNGKNPAFLIVKKSQSDSVFQLLALRGQFVQLRQLLGGGLARAFRLGFQKIEPLAHGLRKLRSLSFPMKCEQRHEPRDSLGGNILKRKGSSERFAPFWSAFIHVLRNAVDHGIDDHEQRERRGKPRQAHIRVATRIAEGNFVVMVEDDGPGVDWQALRAKAGALGIDPAVIGERQNLVFLPGVSTKSVVTELSGRGVGMVAVRDACEALGGRVSVESEEGHGTRVSFVFPKDHAIYEGHESILRAAV